MNPKTKVYVGDKQINWQKHNRKVKMQRRLHKANRYFLTIMAGVIAVTVVYVIGYNCNNTVEIKTEQIEIIKEVTTKANVLERIAKCESGNTHYDKNGQVLVRGNEGSRLSVDVGVMQINMMYWGKKATELGLNLMIESDNRKMAEYIFNNFGTDAWNSSKKCWNK